MPTDDTRRRHRSGASPFQGASLAFVSLAIAFIFGQACVIQRTAFVETYPSAMRKVGFVDPLVFLDQEDVENAKPFATRGVLEMRMMEVESQDTFTDELKAEGARFGCEVLVRRDAYRMRSPTYNTMGPTFRPVWRGNGMVARQYLCGVWPSDDSEAQHSLDLALVAAKRLRADGQGDDVGCSTDARVGTHIREQSCP
jgi:hypothetical protein